MDTYKKKYEDALERARKLQENSNGMILKKWLWNIFPELKENEDGDEKIVNAIRKELKACIEDLGNGVTRTACLAWLEKQGEQKSLDDVAKVVTKNKETAMSFLKSCGIMNANGELADEYKIEQGEQKSADSYCQENCKGFQETGKCFADGDCKAKREAESIDKAEPKFKIGDWITDGYLHNKITDVLEDRYIVETKYAKRSAILFEYESRYHLWTIQDAKDGDVLCLYYNNRKTFFIFKAIIGEGDYADILVHCCYTGKYQYLEPSFNGECRMHQISDGGYCLPADKEEQGILFQKMKEAGYEWDAENKELKKIHVIDEGKAEMDYCFTKMMNGEKVSSAWSEEDERLRRKLIELIYSVSYCDERENLSNWLKSLRQRIEE